MLLRSYLLAQGRNIPNMGTTIHQWFVITGKVACLYRLNNQSPDKHWPLSTRSN